MPEIPEIKAHAERLESLAAGDVLRRIEPLSFTAFKTASPPPSDAVGWSLRSVTQRAKFLLLRFVPEFAPELEPTVETTPASRAGTTGGAAKAGLTFVVHLMQGGRLRVLAPTAKRPRRPRDGLVRFEFDSGLGLVLTEPGTQKRAGVWVLPGDLHRSAPLAGLGPEATALDTSAMSELMAVRSTRLHNFLRDQRVISGLGRRLANEICHRARLSPFAPVGRLDAESIAAVVAAIGTVVEESLAFERGRSEMSRSAERPSAVHGRTGQPCPVCSKAVRAVTYNSYSVNYCAGCQTDGRVLADNTTSKFLR
ncbi:DNA-formamidopyrimidine glycosylase family protein [Candidatus Poriferisodalis sp.]|uniref:DNA-formamidopyrimidine glycosylase family protein n=1 Tax=Candidatus Poriferisodalis sp. TaxID=3101277 RepID=UPI003B018FAD